MGAILAFLSGWAARLLGVGALRFALWKAILWTFVVSVLPTVLYNLLSSLISEYIAMVSNYTTGSGQTSYVVTLSGLAAWLAVQLKIPESFSLILSAVVFRIGIRLIPFFGRVI